jgi:hypothetical protein
MNELRIELQLGEEWPHSSWVRVLSRVPPIGFNNVTLCGKDIYEHIKIGHIIGYII